MFKILINIYFRVDFFIISLYFVEIFFTEIKYTKIIRNGFNYIRIGLNMQ